MKVKVNDKLYFATIKKIDEISRQEAGLDKAGSYYECRIGLGLKPCGKCVFAVDDDSAMAIIKLIKKYCLEKLIMDLTVKPEDSESKFKDVYLSSGFEYDDTEKEYTWAVYLDEEIDNDDSVIDFAVKE